MANRKPKPKQTREHHSLVMQIDKKKKKGGREGGYSGVHLLLLGMRVNAGECALCTRTRWSVVWKHQQRRQSQPKKKRQEKKRKDLPSHCWLPDWTRPTRRGRECTVMECSWPIGRPLSTAFSFSVDETNNQHRAPCHPTEPQSRRVNKGLNNISWHLLGSRWKCASHDRARPLERPSPPPPPPFTRVRLRLLLTDEIRSS